MHAKHAATNYKPWAYAATLIAVLTVIVIIIFPITTTRTFTDVELLGDNTTSYPTHLVNVGWTRDPVDNDDALISEIATSETDLYLKASNSAARLNISKSFPATSFVSLNFSMFYDTFYGFQTYEGKWTVSLINNGNPVFSIVFEQATSYFSVNGITKTFTKPYLGSVQAFEIRIGGTSVYASTAGTTMNETVASPIVIDGIQLAMQLVTIRVVYTDIALAVQ